MFLHSTVAFYEIGMAPLGGHMAHAENHWDKRTNTFYCYVSGLDFLLDN